jgi:hypothetical protein
MININKIVNNLVTESLLQQKDVLERLSKHREFLKKQFPSLFCRMCPLGNTKTERSYFFRRNLHIQYDGPPVLDF